MLGGYGHNILETVDRRPLHDDFKQTGFFDQIDFVHGQDNRSGLALQSFYKISFRIGIRTGNIHDHQDQIRVAQGG